jgi:hypothetical protein
MRHALRLLLVDRQKHPHPLRNQRARLAGEAFKRWRWRLTVPAVSGAAILNPNFGEPEIADRVGLFSWGAGPIAVRALHEVTPAAD